MSTLNISDYDYQRILTSVGYPIISESDLGVTPAFIKDHLILPALKENFFKWFPITESQQISAGTSFSVDFPDENTFGVTDVRLVVQGRGAIRTGNPLINELNIKVKEGSYQNKWDTGNDYGYAEVFEMERARAQSVVSTNKSLRKHVDYQNRKVTGYTNVTGDISITWAKHSNDFDDVPFKFKEDVIKLSQSMVLQYFGRLRNQSTSNLPTELDGTDFIDRADELYEEVMQKWRQYTKVVLIRN